MKINFPQLLFFLFGHVQLRILFRLIYPPPPKQNKQKPSYVHKLSRILSKRKKDESQFQSCCILTAELKSLSPGCKPCTELVTRAFDYTKNKVSNFVFFFFQQRDPRQIAWVELQAALSNQFSGLVSPTEPMQILSGIEQK